MKNWWLHPCRSQITSRFSGEGIEEFGAVQTQNNYSFFGNFVKKEEKLVYLRDEIYEWLLSNLVLKLEKVIKFDF